MIVADTDMLVHALRGREPARTRIAEALAAGQLATTAITAFELRSGADNDHTRAAIEQLLAPLELLPFDDAAAIRAGKLRRALEAGRHPDRDGELPGCRHLPDPWRLPGHPQQVSLRSG